MISNVQGYRESPPTQKHLITPHTHLQAYIIISSDKQAGCAVILQKNERKKKRKQLNNMFDMTICQMNEVGHYSLSTHYRFNHV